MLGEERISSSRPELHRCDGNYLLGLHPRRRSSYRVRNVVEEPGQQLFAILVDIVRKTMRQLSALAAHRVLATFAFQVLAAQGIHLAGMPNGFEALLPHVS